MKSGERVRIDGPTDLLEELRQEILAATDGEVEVEPVTNAIPGELRDPVTVGMMIDPETLAAIVTVAQVIERFLDRQERKEDLRIRREHGDREISVAELRVED